MDEQQRRQVACITTIAKLLTGKYVKEEGWKPNYILTDGNLKISRVNLLGIVVNTREAESSFQSIMLDDTTAMINVREFEDTNILNNLNPGDKIMVIGRPREFNNNKYIIPEIVKKIDNDKWFELRKLHIKLEELRNRPATETSTKKTEETKDGEVVQEDEMIVDSEPLNVQDKIIETIRKLDNGAGIDIDKIVEEVKEDNTETIISNLLKQGEIFELKPGKIKVLD